MILINNTENKNKFCSYMEIIVPILLKFLCDVFQYFSSLFILVFKENLPDDTIGVNAKSGKIESLPESISAEGEMLSILDHTEDDEDEDSLISDNNEEDRMRLLSEPNGTEEEGSPKHDNTQEVVKQNSLKNVASHTKVKFIIHAFMVIQANFLAFVKVYGTPFDFIWSVLIGRRSFVNKKIIFQLIYRQTVMRHKLMRKHYLQSVVCDTEMHVSKTFYVHSRPAPLKVCLIGVLAEIFPGTERTGG